MDYENMSLDELKDYAKSIGLSFGKIGKDKLIEKIKEKEHKEPKRKRSKIRDKSFLHKKIRKTKRSLYGRVLTVNCIDENNSII